jgi:hypothetical protein
MVWDVLVAAAFVVVSVTILVRFGFKFILTWLKKPHLVAPPYRSVNVIALYSRLRQGLIENSRLWTTRQKKVIQFGISSGGRYDTRG